MNEDYKKIFYDFTLKEYFKSFNELIILSSLLIAAIMSIFKLYEVEIPEKKDLFSRTAIALLIFFSISYFNLVISSYNYSWQILFLFYLLTTFFAISSRLIIFRLEKKSVAAKNIAVVGGTQEVKELITKIQDKPDNYNLKTVIANEYEESLEQQLSNEIDIYFGFKWLEPTVDRLENADILLIVYNNLDDKVRARLFTLKTSSKTKIYILPPSYDTNFFDPDLTR